MGVVPEPSCPRHKSLFPGVTTSGALIYPTSWENSRESPPGATARSRPVQFRKLEARRAKCGFEASVDGDTTSA